MAYFPEVDALTEVTIHIGGGHRSEAFPARYKGEGVWHSVVERGDGQEDAFLIHPTHQPEWAALDIQIEA